jgi:FixJ family two-component response regulator
LHLVDRNITNEDDWKAFESNFEQAHEEFLKRIKKEYPNLTPSDLKLCAYIRMNLSSKKIAPLLGISMRGVENHRYRLRKKMELERDVNLTAFIMEF